MPVETNLRVAIKNFAGEAERFKINDLAQLLKQSAKQITKVMRSMIETGELKGYFTMNNEEFVTSDRIKNEIMRILKDPQVLNNK
jgi:Mn-dependent DtxR family transcriptional regulator